MIDRASVILRLLVLLEMLMASVVAEAEVKVMGLRVWHRHGQTFITWKDAGEGEAGVKYRYSLYRGPQPITNDNLDQAELCSRGILHYSAKLYGSAFTNADRIDPAKPYAVVEEDGKPLAPWSGLAVHTVRKSGKAYYAVVATNLDYENLSGIVPGENATTVPVQETPGPINPSNSTILMSAKGQRWQRRPSPERGACHCISNCMGATRAAAERAVTATTMNTLAHAKWDTAMGCRASSPFRKVI